VKTVKEPEGGFMQDSVINYEPLSSKQKTSACCMRPASSKEVFSRKSKVGSGVFRRCHRFKDNKRKKASDGGGRGNGYDPATGPT